MLKKLFRLGYCIGFPLVMLIVCEAITRHTFGMVLVYLRRTPFWNVLINYAIYFMLFNLFQFIKRKNVFVLSQCLMSFVLIIMAVISRYKMLLRLEPVLPTDVMLVRDGMNIAASYIPHFYLMLVAAAVILVAGVVGVLVLARKKERRQFITPAVISLILVAICTTYLFSSNKNVVYKTIKAHYLYGFSLVRNVDRNGNMFEFMNYSRTTIQENKAPEGYTREAMEELVLKAAESEKKLKEARPNVIFLLGESMYDFDLLEGFEFTTDPLKNIHAFMSEYTSGYLKVDTFGGGTTTPEGQILTGLSLNPYTDHHMDSIAWRLKPLGYEATAIHNYWGWFYDRRKNMEAWGFDRFISLESMTKTPRKLKYPNDDILVDTLLETLKRTEKPDLIYAATMQTHGGYSESEMGILYDKPISITALSKEQDIMLNNFLYLQAQADQNVADLIAALSTFEEPTMLVFFGDHAPALKDIILEAVDNRDDKPQYKTPYFIWANFPLEKKTKDMHIAQLTAYAMDKVALPVTVSHRLGRDKIAKPLLTFDAQYGEKYAHPLETRVNEHYEIGYQPIVDSAVLSADCSTLTLRGADIAWSLALEWGGDKWYFKADTNGSLAQATLPEALCNRLQNENYPLNATLNVADSYERPLRTTEITIIKE